MSRQEPVGDIRRPSDSGSGDKDRLEFIRCVDGLLSEIHEVWTFGEEGVIREVHLTARVDAGAFVGEFFATNNLTPTCRRIPMFGRNSINGIVELLVITNLLRNDGLSWTLNLLAPYANWGYRGSSISPNLGSGSGRYSDSVSINCNIYHQRILEKPCSNLRCAVTISLCITARTAYKVLPLVATPYAVDWLTSGMTPWMTTGIYLFVNNFCGEFTLVVSVSVILLLFL